MKELQQAEKELFELTQKVAGLRRDQKAVQVDNYTLGTCDGEVSELAIHKLMKRPLWN
jgi:hypothetical protein